MIKRTRTDRGTGLVFYVITRTIIVNLLLLKHRDEPIVQDVLLGFPCAVPAN